MTCALLLLGAFGAQLVHVCTAMDFLGVQDLGSAAGSGAVTCLICATAQSALPAVSLAFLQPIAVTAEVLVAPPVDDYAAPETFALRVRPPPAT